jgi:hypothetical protein
MASLANRKNNKDDSLLENVRNAINDGSFTEDSEISDEERELLAAPIKNKT